jgi:meso-butanediol dehydrogenase / (S,S)-butanediol dehydrogenase / diacetyl reductase
VKLLNEKIILLTGGSEGIGLECAKAYVAAGARVAVAALDNTKLEEIRAMLGEEHLAIACDVSSNASVKEAIERTLKVYGRLDAIHNNAGLAEPAKALHDTTDAEWDNLMNVNLRGILHTTRHGLEALKATKGCILNTGSLVGSIGQDVHAAYAGTKGAVSAMTKSMALDYAPYGIRVNAVAPAAVRTPMLEKWIEDLGAGSSTMLNYVNRLHPLGPCPAGDVIADACVFLLCPMARFITGCVLPVGGGAELGYRNII